MAVEEKKADGGSPTVSLGMWFALSSGILGLMWAWAMEDVFFTPAMLAAGAGPELAGYVWVASPVIQVVMGPWLGNVSDQMTEAAEKKLREGGERGMVTVPSPRRGMVGALVAIAAVALCLAASAPSLGPLLGDKGEFHPWTFSLLVVGFTFLDACASLNDGFQRSLITDMAPTSRKDRLRGHSVLSFMLGLGSALGYAFGAVNWTKLRDWLHLDAVRGGGLVPAVALSLIVFLPSSAVTLSIARIVFPPPDVEKPKGPDPALEDPLGAPLLTPADGEVSAPAAPAPPMWQVHRWVPYMFARIPRGVVPLLLSQVASWLSMWPIWQFGTSFFAEVIYDGSPEADAGAAHVRFQEGIRMGSLALGVWAVMASLASTVIPWVTQRLGGRVVWSGALVLASAGLFLAGFAHHILPRGPKAAALAIAGVAVVGPAWCTQNALPFAHLRYMLMRTGRAADLAFYSNLLYLAQTVSQLLTGIVVGPIVQASSFSAAMLIGASAAAFAAFLPYVFQDAFHGMGRAMAKSSGPGQLPTPSPQTTITTSVPSGFHGVQ